MDTIERCTICGDILTEDERCYCDVFGKIKAENAALRAEVDRLQKIVDECVNPLNIDAEIETQRKAALYDDIKSDLAAAVEVLRTLVLSSYPRSFVLDEARAFLARMEVKP